jgi:hypothetical protein
MARIRSIKPEFFTSLTIADQPLSARLTFIGLWTYVDDNGVGLADPRLIRAAVWPLEETPDILQRTREDLQRLHAAGLITLYTASGKALVSVSSWDEHQKVSHPRKPRFPRPTLGQTGGDTPPDQGSYETREDSGNPPEDYQSPPEILRPEQGAGSREQGAGITTSSAPAPRTPDPANDRADVERICQHLADRIEGNGSKRPAITKAWRTAARLMLDKDGRTEQQVHGAIEWCQDSEFWRANVLSLPKLREKYDTLRLQATRPAGGSVVPIGAAPSARPSTADQRAGAAYALALELAAEDAQ